MKVTRLLIIFSLLGFCVSGAVAQAPTAGAVASKKATKHCLWQVTGASNTVYLLGSMHFMRDNMYPLAPEIESAYKQASMVVFETDMKTLETPEFAMKLLAKGSYPKGESLKKNLSPAMYSLLVTNLQSSMVTVEMLDPLKPWMVAMTIVLVELQKQGFDMQNGVDKHFFSRALENKKSVDHFEEPEFQADLFTGLTDKESEDFLGQTLRDMDIWKKQLDTLEKAWLTGDAEALDKLLLDSFREYPLMHKKFLIDRNRAWMQKLEQFLKSEKDVLVVVGAGHLVGKDSVVGLLTVKGYKVRQR